MVSCLTLITARHSLAGGSGAQRHTACGLSIADAHCTSTTFADVGDDVTCPKCLTVVGARTRTANRPQRPIGPRDLVLRLMEVSMSAGDADGLSAAFGGGVDRALAGRRLTRLHAIFPGWRATVAETIADEGGVLARYTVTCRDDIGLLGKQGQEVVQQDCAIFRVGGGHVRAVEPLRDSFDFWTNLNVRDGGSRPGTDGAPA